MDIKHSDLKREFQLYQDEYESKALEVLRRGWYILGQEVEQFEKEWARYTGAQYCIGVGSGLDAIALAIRALGIKAGDEVLVPANTYIASAIGITLNGATPVFVDVDKFYSIDAKELKKKITERTKAILAVHLYGVPCEMDSILQICEEYKLQLLEDCAQSHGATYHGKMTGTFGDVGCFSFYPTKNVGGFGDGGAVITNNPIIYEKIRMYRNYGSKERYIHEVIGVNSRLDEIQAGLLRVKISHIEELTKGREKIACYYLEKIRNEKIYLPIPREKCRSVWHQFVIRCCERDGFMKYMKQNGIDTLIHYPIPLHLSKAYAYLEYKKGTFPASEVYADTICSLPIYNGMTNEEIDYVIKKVNEF